MAQNTKITEVHISTIQAGDTIKHEGIIKTVSGTDIKTGGFFGVSIFGDSYNAGYKKVLKVTFLTN